jgi:hypothetical protein
MRYQKPVSRDLDELVVAAGLCATGTNPVEECTTGNTNSASCNAGAAHAGSPCEDGTGATTCATGTFAAP